MTSFNLIILEKMKSKNKFFEKAEIIIRECEDEIKELEQIANKIKEQKVLEKR